MSNSSSSADRSSPNGDGPTNPFVAFRHFADSQMSALVNNVFGIFQSSPIRRQQAIDDFETMLERHDEFDRRIQEARSAMGLYARANHGDADEARPTRADSEDDGERPVEGMRCPYRRPEKLGLLDQMLRPSALDVSYIFMSSYSPLALERQEIFREHSGKLRAAFADLMAMEAGEGLLPENTIEKHAHSDPLRWAAEMAQLTAYGRSGMRKGMFDRQNLDERPIRWRISRLPAEFGRFDEERQGSIDSGKEESRGEDEDEDEDRREAYRVLRAMASSLKPLKSTLGGDDEEQKEDQKELDGAEKNVVPEAREEVLIAEPEVNNEQPEADEKDNACMCLHCRNYERRREEFRQWRREERDEEEGGQRTLSDNDDDERTTNPTSELDQYHTLADYQAHLLRAEQQSTPRKSEKLSATEASPTPEKQFNSNFNPNATFKSSILSTLTTTEQRTLPDGTTTTKVVLKKRFSDGAEEVTERIHTQNGTSPEQKTPTTEPRQGQALISEMGKNEKREGMEQEKKRGWFWS